MIRRRAAALAAALVLAWPAAARADGVETSGEILRVAIPVAALGVAWHRQDGEGVSQFLWAYGATVGATLALKAVVDEPRPDGSGDDAFPSGHAATAFAGAAVLQRRYGWRTAWPAWVLAAWTGWTRVDADEHDWGDVAGGAAVAAASAWLLVDPRSDVVAAPAILPGGGLGLRVSGRF